MVPASMEGLLCLLPDLLRHVCLENTSELSHGTSELHREDDVRALHFADMFVLVQMFLQQFKSPPPPAPHPSPVPLGAREKFESSCFESLSV